MWFLPVNELDRELRESPFKGERDRVIAEVYNRATQYIFETVKEALLEIECAADANRIMGLNKLTSLYYDCNIIKICVDYEKLTIKEEGQRHKSNKTFGAAMDLVRPKIVEASLFKEGSPIWVIIKAFFLGSYTFDLKDVNGPKNMCLDFNSVLGVECFSAKKPWHIPSLGIKRLKSSVEVLVFNGLNFSEFVYGQNLKIEVKVNKMISSIIQEAKCKLYQK
jgi:hypothetical protein